MSTRAQLSEAINRLLPGEQNKRIRQAILEAATYSGQRTDQLRKNIDDANRIQTGILVKGLTSILTNTSAEVSGYVWTIDFAISQPSTVTALTINAPESVHSRDDYFIGLSNGTIVYRAGTVDALGNSFPPEYDPLTEVVLRIVRRNADGSNDEIETPESNNLIDFPEQDIIPYVKESKLKNSGIKVIFTVLGAIVEYFFPYNITVNGKLRVNDLIYHTPANSTISSATTLSINMTSGKNLKRYLLQANLTINFSADLSATESASFTFVFKQDATGGRAVNWNTTGTAVMWQGGTAPLIDDGVNKITVITIIWTGYEYLGFKSCGF